MWATSCTEFPLERTSHWRNVGRTQHLYQSKRLAVLTSQLISQYYYTWARVRSSLKKLKTLWGDTGSQTEVAALRMTPLGWPGSVLLRTVIRTPTSSGPESVIHWWPLEALMLEQKLMIILWASFIRLLLPSGEGITVGNHWKEHQSARKTLFQALGSASPGKHKKINGGTIQCPIETFSRPDNCRDTYDPNYS